MVKFSVQVHAVQTENYLNGKKLGDLDTFQSALKLLNEELNPEEELLKPDSDYLKTVAQGLLFKVICFI
jgi:xanthine dehydrogenase/oxidase